MLNLKHLSRWLYVADMAICCDLCGKDTWSADLPTDDIYEKHIWHDKECPLYGSKEAYDHWADDSQDPPARTYPGKIEVHVHKEGARTKHTAWLRTDDDQLMRLSPVADAFDSIDIRSLDGASVIALGNAIHSGHASGKELVLYFSMILDRSYV